MRLGTKSCAECRRRKIRCVLQQGQTVCDSCVAHDTQCLAQQPKSGPPPASNGVSDDIKKRLAELEQMVSQVHGPMSLTNDSPATSIGRGSKTEASPVSLNASTAFTTPPHLGSEGYSSGSVPGNASVHQDEPEALATFADAPLLSLFNSTNLARRAISVPDVDVGTNQRTENLISTARQLMPSHYAVRSVIQEVGKFFGLWSPCSYGPDNSLHIQANMVDEAYDFMQQALQSSKPSLVAKAVLFWAHCIQQLPCRSACHKLLPSNLIALATEYTNLASTMLFVSASRGDNIDGIEAKYMLYKLAIDLGKPRLAWTAAKAAVESCLMLGFHRNSAGRRGKAIWAQVWGLDRQPSVMLGLFPSIPNGHPSIPSCPVGPNLFAQINYKINILFGAICERDQQEKERNYAKTVEIDQEASEMLSIIPPEWYDPSHIATLPLEHRYGILTTHIRTQAIVRSIHLPWMLKSSTEPRYQHSRSTCLDAARAGSRFFSVLRKDTDIGGLNCELMDHESFLSSIVIVVGRLTEKPEMLQCAQPTEIREDFALLDESALRLRMKSEETGCLVAAQASRVLDYLLGAMRHDPGIPDHFETAIPSFGQVRINKKVLENLGGVGSTAKLSVQDPCERSLSHVIEFTADPFHQHLPFEFTFGDEVTMNWQDAMDWDVEYDWNQAFCGFDFSSEAYNFIE